MKLKMGFKADEPTVNGHIYSKNVLTEAIKEFNEREDHFLTLGINKEKIPVVNFKDAIGVIENIILGDNIYLKIRPINSILKSLYEELKDKLIVLPVGYGSIDENQNISNYKISYFHTYNSDDLIKKE